jgi:adenosine/AMP kinase
MSTDCENNKRLAPIALFVYNRPGHTRKTIEALQNNVLAGESDLIIFSDGPKNSANDLKDIEEVRKICSETVGFKNVIVKCSSQNRGLARAIIAGVTQMCDEYG